MVILESEATARLRIDRELTASGWDLEDPAQVRLEHHTTSGRTDYLLLDEYGRPACVLEAKRHATEITKTLNAIQPNLAVTITSRVRDASAIAKEFRDGKREERVAVSVNMLSTGYNCQDLLNVVLMRPVFSPTEYIQIEGRGTRLHTFVIGNIEYHKEWFFLLDFCAVAEYFEEEYDYSVPLSVPTERKRDERTTLISCRLRPTSWQRCRMECSTWLMKLRCTGFSWAGQTTRKSISKSLMKSSTSGTAQAPKRMALYLSQYVGIWTLSQSTAITLRTL